MEHIWRRLELGEVQCFRQDSEGVLWFKDHLVVPKIFELNHKIMDEAHCSRYSIHPGTNKMYQDLKKNEEGNRKICVRVWHVSKGQGRSFEASWKSATFEHFWVEVGKHLHGLHRGFALHLTWVQFDMGHCGLPNQVGSLYTRIHHIQGPIICRALPITHYPLSWYPEDHHLWQRVYLCGMILGTTIWLFGHPSHPQFSQSSPDRWAKWTS
jgi:hypothetical protein